MIRNSGQKSSTTCSSRVETSLIEPLIIVSLNVHCRVVLYGVESIFMVSYLRNEGEESRVIVDCANPCWIVTWLQPLIKRW
jgi:hypothetical protein